MKYILISLIILTGCSTSKTSYTEKKYSLTEDVNMSIVNDFYDGDTTKVSSQVYLLK